MKKSSNVGTVRLCAVYLTSLTLNQSLKPKRAENKVFRLWWEVPGLLVLRAYANFFFLFVICFPPEFHEFPELCYYVMLYLDSD